eukprot:3211710-Prymnesium_polylepis.1
MANVRWVVGARMGLRGLVWARVVATHRPRTGAQQGHSGTAIMNISRWSAWSTVSTGVLASQPLQYAFSYPASPAVRPEPRPPSDNHVRYLPRRATHRTRTGCGLFGAQTVRATLRAL